MDALNLPPQSAGLRHRVVFYDESAGLRHMADHLAVEAGLSVSTFFTEHEVVEHLIERRADVLVIGGGMQPHGPLDLARRLRDQFPDMVRILISGYMSPAMKLRAAELCHRALPAEITPAELHTATNAALKVRGLISKPAVRAHVASIGELPALPNTYFELNDLFHSEHASAREVVATVSKDPALLAKIMQLVNSAFFGLERQIGRIEEAVTLLGTRLIRDLALMTHLYGHLKQADSWKSFSFEQLNLRSMAVARLARDIARSAGADRSVQDHAFLAGLLHDIGIQILVRHDPVAYREVMERSIELNRPLYAVEKLLLGVHHGEVGACLMGLWNLPAEVVEAILLHHCPNTSASDGFSALSAVHVADSLLPSVVTALECDLANRLSDPYLQRIGMGQELGRWQLAANQYRLQMVVL